MAYTLYGRVKQASGHHGIVFFFVKKGCWGLLPPLYYYWIIFYMPDYPGINALKIHYESNNRFSDLFRWQLPQNFLSFKTPQDLLYFLGSIEIGAT